MRLRYRDGSEGDDKLFDLPPEAQIANVARCLDCDPSAPDGWPRSIIEKLLSVRRYEGKDSFYREIGRMLSPDFH